MHAATLCLKGIYKFVETAQLGLSVALGIGYSKG